MMMYFLIGVALMLLYIFFMVRYCEQLMNTFDEAYFAFVVFGALFFALGWVVVAPLVLVVFLGIKFRKKS